MDVNFETVPAKVFIGDVYKGTIGIAVDVNPS